MATGTLTTAEIIASSAGINPAYDAAGEQWPIPGTSAVAPAGFGGTQTNTQPVDEIGLSIAGGFSPCFVRDWYNRIHVAPTAFELGNVISAQSLPVTFWNAYFETRSITEISTPSEGITVVGTPAPTTVRSLGTIVYTLSIGLDGPPVIDDTVTFTFDVGAFPVSISGSRIVPWLFQPNGEVRERLEWLTGVIQSFNGSEQRQRLRKTPRRFFEYSFTIIDSERRQAENLLFGWQARQFALPVWMDGATISSTLAAGSTSISTPTAGLDYHDNGTAILTTSPSVYEVVTVETVGDGVLNLLRPTETEWPAGAKIYPVRLARLPESIALRRFTGGVSYGRAIWQCSDLSTWDTSVESTYRGFPVLEQSPEWSEDVESRYNRKMTILDAGTGGRYFDDEAGIPLMGQSHRWIHVDRDEITAFRSWLYNREGRLSAFWLPSWAQDLSLQVLVNDTDITIDVEFCNYTKQAAQAVGRRDIRIELHDGTVLYRRIESAEEVTSAIERLTLDTALGVEVQPSDVRVISFMTLSRLEGDAAELLWWNHQTTEVGLRTRSAANDL